MFLETVNPTVSGFNIEKGTAEICFDVSWNGAWKNNINCDGAWIFAKYRTGCSEWQHVELASDSFLKFDYKNHTPEGFSKGEGGTSKEIGMWVPETRKGLFLFRIIGKGDVSSQKVKMLWDISGIKEKLTGDVEIRVLGIEMVYVPEGGHYVGDPEGPNNLRNCFYRYPGKKAYYIDSEKAIEVAPKEGCLYCNQDTPFSRDAETFIIPEEFPKGFNEMWYMKYSLTCRQYVDFLNMLTRKQQQGRVASDISGDFIENYYVMTNTNTEFERQAIICRREGNGTEKPVKFYTNAPQRACNVTSWGDVTAFACWSGLRPITELEYEKAARGTADPVPGEFAWGTTNIGRVFHFDGSDGSGYEKKLPEDGIVNCNYGTGIAPFEKDIIKEPRNPGWIGPVSVGLFANSGSELYTERENSGASFYGVMEMCGNVWEQIVSTGKEAGRKYKPVHGTGRLTEDGNQDIHEWPNPITGEGGGVRGGVFVSPEPLYVVMAFRGFAANSQQKRRFHGGIRVGF